MDLQYVNLYSIHGLGCVRSLYKQPVRGCIGLGLKKGGQIWLGEENGPRPCLMPWLPLLADIATTCISDDIQKVLLGCMP